MVQETKHSWPQFPTTRNLKKKITRVSHDLGLLDTNNHNHPSNYSELQA